MIERLPIELPLIGRRIRADRCNCQHRISSRVPGQIGRAAHQLGRRQPITRQLRRRVTATPTALLATTS